MAKTLTGNNPQREQRVQQIMLERIALKYQRRISREIARAMNESANNLSDTTKQPAILAKHKAKLGRILNSLWFESGEDMANHIGSYEKSIVGYQTKNDGQDIPSTLIANITMNSWVGQYGTSKIVGLARTTQDDVSAIIKRGIDDGLSERETAKAIKALSFTRAAGRAGTIARTETHSAANVAAQATAKAAGVKMRREWVAAKNERTRKAHRDADGQIVGMNEPFKVGGYDLMYPSDYSSNAPARLTINCRCAVAYIL